MGLLCLEFISFICDLLANTNQLVNDVSKASVLDDKVYIVVKLVIHQLVEFNVSYS